MNAPEYVFACQECGKKFKTTRAAERASSVGCPKCGGVDIDVDAIAERYEIRNDLAIRQPYPRNGNVGQQRPTLTYTVHDKATGRAVSSPLPRLKDAREFLLTLAQGGVS